MKSGVKQYVLSYNFHGLIWVLYSESIGLNQSASESYGLIWKHETLFHASVVVRSTQLLAVVRLRLAVPFHVVISTGGSQRGTLIL